MFTDVLLSSSDWPLACTVVLQTCTDGYSRALMCTDVRLSIFRRARKDILAEVNLLPRLDLRDLFGFMF